jgi:uncharacterized membrane protein
MGKIDLGLAFSKGWDMFSKNIAAMIVGGLLTILIGGFSLGILMPAMAGGMYTIIRKAYHGQPAEIGDVFAGFSNFGQLFLGGLIVLGLILLGVLACGIGVIVTGAIVVFLFPLIVDGFSAGEAFHRSWEGFKKNWVGYLVVSIVVGLVMGAGNMAVYVGSIFTLPFGMCVNYVAYKQEFAEAPAATPVAPPTA